MIQTPRQRDDGVWIFPRQQFFSERFAYEDGQHVLFGGPSTRGKTECAFDGIQYVARPDCPALVAVSKPTDKTSLQRGAELGFRRVDEWPPRRRVSEIMGDKPRGYLIWPHLGDINSDVAKCAKITRDLLMHTYANGAKNQHAILVMDDTMVKAKILGLDGEMVTILAMAGAMGVGLWIFIQKPTDSGRTTLWGYENCTHLFLTKGGDSKMLARYMEVAGEYGPQVKRIIPTLEPFQFLYMHKYEGWICIVDAKP